MGVIGQKDLLSRQVKSLHQAFHLIASKIKPGRIPKAITEKNNIKSDQILLFFYLSAIHVDRINLPTGITIFDIILKVLGNFSTEESILRNLLTLMSEVKISVNLKYNKVVVLCIPTGVWVLRVFNYFCKVLNQCLGANLCLGVGYFWPFSTNPCTWPEGCVCPPGPSTL